MNAKKKVMVFGTFDIIHPGHVAFFKNAKRYGNYFIVSIARNVNVRKVKGRAPLHTEKERRALVSALRLADKVVFGDRKNYLTHILREKPDTICLGYDQKAYTAKLQEKLARAGLHVKIVRLKAYQSKRYKSSKILHEL